MKRKRKGFKSCGGGGGGKWNTKLPVTTRSNDRLLLLLNTTKNNNSFLFEGVLSWNGLWRSTFFHCTHGAVYCCCIRWRCVSVFKKKMNRRRRSGYRVNCRSLSQSPSSWWLSIPTIWSLRLYWKSLRCLIWWQSERIKAANWIQALNKTSCRQQQRH